MANRKITKDVSDFVIAGAVLANFYLNKLDRLLEWGSKTTVIVKGSNNIPINIGDNWYLLDTDITLSTATDMDTGAISNGKDYYVYLCESAGSVVGKISLNSTVPTGFTAATSRKIGGFHTLCVAAGNIAGSYTARANSTAYTVGDVRRPAVANSRYYACVTAGTSAASEPAAFTSDTTSTGAEVTDGTVIWRCQGHDLNGYLANEVLPQSVWDLKHRCRNSKNEGMRYCLEINKWKQIYLAADDGAGGVKSAYGATILDTIDWMTFVDKGGKAGMRLLDDAEFQVTAEGCNQITNIFGSADPVTAGGHIDTASRRMLSNGGDEDDAGALWQWLRDQSWRYDGGSHTHAFTGSVLPTHTHTENQEASYTQNVQTAGTSGGTPAGSNASVDPAPVWANYTLPGSKGKLYHQGTYGDVKLIAGGGWCSGSFCGSRSRHAYNSRWIVYTSLGGRFLAEPL